MVLSSPATVPPGSQDLLPDDVRRRRAVQHRWFELAAAAGYAEVIPPTFEYEEVFTRGGGPELAARLIRFVDRDGRVVALRADFTSALARLAATRLREAPLPLRLSYAGKVYRQAPESSHALRETFQLGAELIGAGEPWADAEIVRLAIQTLRALGLEHFQVNLGDIGFVRPLLAAVPPEAREALRSAIDRKDATELALAAAVASPAAAATLAELPALVGRGEVLARAAALAPSRAAGAAVARLQTLDASLSPAERAHVVYDLGEVRGLGYYTGFQFEVFVRGVGRAVGAGGRYDGLLAAYGRDMPAAGFALESDALAVAGEQGG